MRRPSDRDTLPLASGQIADCSGRRWNTHVHRMNELARLLDHSPPVQTLEGTFHQLTAKEQVHVDGLLFGKRQVLEDDLYAALLRAAWIGEAHFLAIHKHAAAGRRVHPA